jgi:hypothetical protein
LNEIGFQQQYCVKVFSFDGSFPTTAQHTVEDGRDVPVAAREARGGAGGCRGRRRGGYDASSNLVVDFLRRTGVALAPELDLHRRGIGTLLSTLVDQLNGVVFGGPFSLVGSELIELAVKQA